MSDQYHWKKTNERGDLDLFLEAYAEATGEGLEVVEERETPDFLCQRVNGRPVGVELTKIIAPPESRQWHRLFGSGPTDFAGDIASGISSAVFSKAQKLRKRGWAVSETILVIHLFDNPLSEINRGLDHIDCEEFSVAGFAEIWISDHSTIEAFGRVDLFGLHPERLAGHYALTFGQKPYG